ncbi:MAG: site-specific integrase, partial [Phycisphaerae bacterium]|nr:site-specific integrase [Phycisphaerae bacterium]
MLEVSTDPVELYLDYLTLECGLSPNTILSYKHDLAKFRDHAGIRTPSDWERIGPDDILHFLMWEKKTGLASATISRSLVAVRMLFKFLLREGLVSNDPTSSLDSPRLWHTLPEVLDKQSVERLL